MNKWRIDGWMNKFSEYLLNILYVLDVVLDVDIVEKDRDVWEFTEIIDCCGR